MNVSGHKGSGAIPGMTWGDSWKKCKEKSQLLWAGAHDLSFEQHPSVKKTQAEEKFLRLGERYKGGIEQTVNKQYHSQGFTGMLSSHN